jgi:hypothetical protein
LAALLRPLGFERVTVVFEPPVVPPESRQRRRTRRALVGALVLVALVAAGCVQVRT